MQGFLKGILSFFILFKPPKSPFGKGGLSLDKRQGFQSIVHTIVSGLFL